jgi:hypothetical protein
VVVDATEVVVVRGVVSAVDVLAATVVGTGCVVVGCDSVVLDGDPHDTAAKPNMARMASLRVALIREVLPSRRSYIGSFTTASPSRSMSARSQ